MDKILRNEEEELDFNLLTKIDVAILVDYVAIVDKNEMMIMREKLKLCSSCLFIKNYMGISTK